jgi:hypothetical protein
MVVLRRTATVRSISERRNLAKSVEVPSRSRRSGDAKRSASMRRELVDVLVSLAIFEGISRTDLTRIAAGMSCRLFAIVT